MCGIVAAIAEREVSKILIEGLKRLEYRGYDSAGLALIDTTRPRLDCTKSVGKVQKLIDQVERTNTSGNLGIAHTRWATHGKPTVKNAHPHTSGNQIALVHNGIIENHDKLRAGLEKSGYGFKTETDSEVIAHLVHQARKGGEVNLLDAVKNAVNQLEGAYGICVIDSEQPDQIVVTRSGSPLVIGRGIGENFIASDALALGQVTDRFIFLEEGDIARIKLDSVEIWNNNRKVTRKTTRISSNQGEVEKGVFNHFMLKEIFEQPKAIRDTLDGRISNSRVLEEAFGITAREIFDRVSNVQIVACGTSFLAGQVAKHWMESIAKLPCHVDIASDYRYRDVIVQPGTLFVSISQSGETADTLAALRFAKRAKYESTLAICNVAISSLVRESDFCLLTQAGQEIGVASTKAFTTQLCLLLLLAIVLGRRHGLSEKDEAKIVRKLRDLPQRVTDTLGLDGQIKKLSKRFANKQHTLFLGRGIQYPVAKEGALKLKEISYIHAEAYPAGELKHGPLALVDSRMPVIAVAPNNELLGKLKANLAEVSARGGKLFVFADESIGYQGDKNCKVIHVPASQDMLDPILFVIPLQLLAYHVAILKGTDVDQPRNLAKSVTVE